MATIIKKPRNINKPWVVRYVDPNDGKQKERSFRIKRDAEDFKADFDFKSREQTFVDPRVANEKFRNAATGWLDRHTGTERTRKTYRAMLDNHILPAMGDKSLAQVARDREGLQTFLLVTMPGKGQGVSQVRQAYMVVKAIVNDAVRSGKLGQSRISGIPMPASPRTKADDFVFPDRGQIEELADALPEDYRAAVFLMRGCGLRVSEALAVRLSDFRDNGTVLRLARQMAPDGKSTIPLKHRKEGEFRDVPVPLYVWQAVPMSHLRAPLFPTVSRRQFHDWFTRARKAAGIKEGFTPHSLRHVFASVALANAVPITDVSRWLGHRNIQTTYAIYSHFIPSSWDRAREALDGEWVA